MLIETVVPRIEEEANVLLGRMTDNRMHIKLETQRERRTGQGEPIEVFLQRPGSSGGASLILAHVNDDPLPEGKSRYGRIIVNTPEAKVIEKRAQAAGAKAREIKIPGDNPPVIIFFNDPDGYEIELYQAPK